MIITYKIMSISSNQSHALVTVDDLKNKWSDKRKKDITSLSQLIDLFSTDDLTPVFLLELKVDFCNLLKSCAKYIQEDQNSDDYISPLVECMLGFNQIDDEDIWNHILDLYPLIFIRDQSAATWGMALDSLVASIWSTLETTEDLTFRYKQVMALVRVINSAPTFMEKISDAQKNKLVATLGCLNLKIKTADPIMHGLIQYSSYMLFRIKSENEKYSGDWKDNISDVVSDAYTYIKTNGSTILSGIGKAWNEKDITAVLGGLEAISKDALLAIKSSWNSRWFKTYKKIFYEKPPGFFNKLGSQYNAYDQHLDSFTDRLSSYLDNKKKAEKLVESHKLHLVTCQWLSFLMYRDRNKVSDAVMINASRILFDQLMMISPMIENNRDENYQHCTAILCAAQLVHHPIDRISEKAVETLKKIQCHFEQKNIKTNRFRSIYHTFLEQALDTVESRKNTEYLTRMPIIGNPSNTLFSWQEIVVFQAKDPWFQQLVTSAALENVRHHLLDKILVNLARSHDPSKSESSVTSKLITSATKKRHTQSLKPSMSKHQQKRIVNRTLEDCKKIFKDEWVQLEEQFKKDVLSNPKKKPSFLGSTADLSKCLDVILTSPEYNKIKTESIQNCATRAYKHHHLNTPDVKKYLTDKRKLISADAPKENRDSAGKYLREGLDAFSKGIRHPEKQDTYFATAEEMLALAFKNCTEGLPDIFAALGRLFLQQKLYRRATDCFERGINLGNVGTKFELAVCLIHVSDTAAERAFHILTDLKRRSIEFDQVSENQHHLYDYHLGLATLAKGSSPKGASYDFETLTTAARFFRESIQLKGTFNAWYQLARVLLNKSLAEDAELLEKTRDENFKALREQIEKKMKRNRDQSDRESPELNFARPKKNLDNITTNNRSIEVDERTFEEGISALMEALKLDPSRPEGITLYLRALLHRIKRSFSDRERDNWIHRISPVLSLVEQRYKKNTDILELVGNYHYIQNEFSKALSYFNRALALDATPISLLKRRAYCYLYLAFEASKTEKTEKIDQAEQAFRLIETFYNNDFSIKFMYTDFLWMTKQYQPLHHYLTILKQQVDVQPAGIATNRLIHDVCLKLIRVSLITGTNLDAIEQLFEDTEAQFDPIDFPPTQLFYLTKLFWEYRLNAHLPLELLTKSLSATPSNIQLCSVECRKIDPELHRITQLFENRRFPWSTVPCNEVIYTLLIPQLAQIDNFEPSAVIMALSTTEDEFKYFKKDVPNMVIYIREFVLSVLDSRSLVGSYMLPVTMCRLSENIQQEIKRSNFHRHASVLAWLTSIGFKSVQKISRSDRFAETMSQIIKAKANDACKAACSEKSSTIHYNEAYQWLYYYWKLSENSPHENELKLDIANMGKALSDSIRKKISSLKKTLKDNENTSNTIHSESILNLFRLALSAIGFGIARNLLFEQEDAVEEIWEAQAPVHELKRLTPNIFKMISHTSVNTPTVATQQSVDPLYTYFEALILSRRLFNRDRNSHDYETMLSPEEFSQSIQSIMTSISSTLNDIKTPDNLNNNFSSYLLTVLDFCTWVSELHPNISVAETLNDAFSHLIGIAIETFNKLEESETTNTDSHFREMLANWAEICELMSKFLDEEKGSPLFKLNEIIWRLIRTNIHYFDEKFMESIQEFSPMEIEHPCVLL